MKSIFDAPAYAEVLERINNLNPNSQRQWGKMSLSQMLCHCKNPLAVGLGKQELKKPNSIMRLLFKGFKTSMYNDKPWKQNLPTPKEFRVETEKHFDEEKSKLLQLIADFHNEKNRKSWEPHPAFGDFTHEQWGQMQYKHLDHHLRQFGV